MGVAMPPAVPLKHRQSQLSVRTYRTMQDELPIVEIKRRLSWRSEEHTSELQSRQYLVCRLLLEKKKKIHYKISSLTYLISNNNIYFYNSSIHYYFPAQRRPLYASQ